MVSSSRSEERWSYDVFLSFRGADTRNIFTGHLYQALRDKGVNVFIDNELQRGKFITSQLLRVIEESRISIILLSENYASSSFCLDELAKILECRVSKEQTVFPVFYHVDPTDVEEQEGTFGQEFAKLEAHLNDHLNCWNLFLAKAASLIRYFLTNTSVTWPIVDDLDEQRNNDEEDTSPRERVQKWRSALTDVARLAGWHLKKGNNESNIIQQIVKKVSKELNYTPLHVAEHPLGLASRVEYILRKLNMESHDVCMIGLHGMGRVGKTTTATALYNTFASQFEFEGSCFLSKVRENSKNIAELQQTLLFEILGDQELKLKDSRKGIELIKRRLRSKQVLIVIDDVDHLEQLQQLAGELKWFGAGSIIIITTRDLRLLEQHEVTMIYEVEKMGFDEAGQLFSWHAFKKSQPDEFYKEFCSRLIRYTRGLPLALKVLGSSLYKRSAEEWDDMLRKLDRFPNKEIDDVLKVSYDSLDSEEKAIFIDIAFFFKGKHKDEVTKFLDACGFGAHFGIQRLIEKSLVYVDLCGRLEMHDLLEAMGTKIALEESSRLCIRERGDIPRLFAKDKSADVEILVLNLYGEEETTLNWLQNLTRLRALIIHNGRFIRMPKKLPNSIRWLEWRNCCLTSIPSEFLPSNLLVLEMPCCNTKKFLGDMSKAQKFMKLIRMDFSGSKELSEMLDFSSIPHLEVLDVSECGNLKKIHKSVKSLKKLKKLVLSRCSSLTSLPSLVENQSLEYIDLEDCSKLEKLPNLPTTITQLHLLNSGIKEIPSFIGNLINLEQIYASNCKNLKCISNSIYKLPYLHEIILRNCPNLPQFPEVESCMVPSSRPSTDVHWHRLSGNNFVSLPINTFKFIHIRFLNLADCEWLVEIPELPRSLRRLNARNCKSLVRFSQFQFDRFDGDFSYCHKIVENEIHNWRKMVENPSFKRMEEGYPKGQELSIVLPGKEIPEWFSYSFECEGNDHSFKLPSLLLNDNLIAIAWYAIFETLRNGWFTLKFSMNDSTLFSWNLYHPLESEHLCLGFYSSFVLPKLLEAEDISFKFNCENKESVFKRVGVHFVYKN